MFKVNPNGPNRIDIEISGKLDSKAMKIALDELTAKSEGIKHGQLLYRIDNFEIPTLGALAVELSRIPELFRLIGRFDRAAVLSSKKWIQNASEIEGALMPGLEIKAFDLDEEAEAEMWLAARAPN